MSAFPLERSDTDELSLELVVLPRHDDGTVLVTAAIVNNTNDWQQLRLVHWAGNGMELVRNDKRVSMTLDNTRVELEPETIALFGTIEGAPLPHLAPGSYVTVSRIYRPIDGARYMPSQPRSIQAFLRDDRSGESLAVAVVPIDVADERGEQMAS